ncbi:MAG: hypothetical protein RQ826_10830 [Xanthomonadales bacterium]|nr:hypothetical protein [Xanthomonadales bacterium]
MKLLRTTFLVLLFLPVQLSAIGAEGAFDQVLTDLADFTRDVRFNKQDIGNFISYWAEVSALDEDENWNDFGESMTDSMDFDELGNDPEYRAWASSRNLDPDDFLKKSMRIYAVQMRTSFPAQADEMRSELTEERMMEGMPEGLSAEDRKKMQDLVQAGLQSLEAMEESMLRLPEPTASERALLEAHQDQLIILLEEGDEEDSDW